MTHKEATKLGRYNACSDPCDVFTGPCSCGAWHSLDDWRSWSDGKPWQTLAYMSELLMNYATEGLPKKENKSNS